MERQTVIDNDAEAAVRQMTVRTVDAENDRATIYDIRALMGQKDGGSSVRNQRKLPRRLFFVHDSFFACNRQITDKLQLSIMILWLYHSFWLWYSIRFRHFTDEGRKV